MSWSDADQAFMERALSLAREAANCGEVPVGAVLVQDLEIIGEGWNCPVSTCDPTAHAEVQALRKAASRTKNYRISGSCLYVTLEPCAMCAGALVHARVSRLVFATRDLRFGAVRSKFRIADSTLLNHQLSVQEGLLAVESAALLKGFFDACRQLPVVEAKKKGSGQEP